MLSKNRIRENRRGAAGLVEALRRMRREAGEVAEMMFRGPANRRVSYHRLSGAQAAERSMFLDTLAAVLAAVLAIPAGFAFTVMMFCL